MLASQGEKAAESSSGQSLDTFHPAIVFLLEPYKDVVGPVGRRNAKIQQTKG